MRKLVVGLKLAAGGLVLIVVTTAATALVGIFGPSDCLRGAVLHGLVPSPTFRLSADRRTLEFDGPITFGVAATMEQLLQAHATIKVVHLTSHGGAVVEARRMAALVKGRRLDTYVSAGCGSACVDVFVAGRERLIGPAGWLGLHQAYVGGPGGTTEAARRIAVGAQLAELVRFGVSEAFARKVVETPPHTYWRPSQRELLAERLATRVVDPAQVAASPRSCRHAPRRADLMASLGALVFNMGSANRALLYLEWAIASDPDHSAALMYRAMSLAHQLQLDRAIEDFDRVINLDPKSVGAFVGRGQIHLQRGDIFRAIRDFDHALSIAYGLAPLEEGVIAAARGVARTKLGQYEGAIADFTRAIELHPSRADLYNARAWAYLKAGKSGHGLPDAERALQLNPAFAAALDTRGQILEALGRHEEAIADFRRALALDPGIEESKEGLKRLGAAP